LDEIKILATDGTNQKEIIWVKVSPNGIYAGWCSQHDQIHVSYHSDGNVYLSIGKKKADRIASSKPLRKFREIYQLCSITLSTNLRDLRVVDYHMKKVAAAVYVDVRPFVDRGAKRGYIDCSLYLLEPRRFDLIRKSLGSSPAQIQLLTQFRPWIVMSISKAEPPMGETSGKWFGVGMDVNLMPTTSFAEVLTPRMACPECSANLKWLESLKRWYCNNCHEYREVKA
jgi:hypothetical protein